MEVSETRIQESPAGEDRIRYSATVSYDDGKREPEEFWFDVPRQFSDALQPSGNPWLAAVLPIAAKINEPVRLVEPVDPRVYEGVLEVLQVWNTWEPDTMHIPKIEAPLAPRISNEPMGRIGSFFSGGVDSFFSAIYHDDLPEGMPRVTDLISCWGFDIPLKHTDEIASARKSLDKAAEALGKTRIDVWTNIRKTRIDDYDWGRYTHGCALAAVALMLEPRFWRVQIPSTWGPSGEELFAWGNHVLTQPKFSSQRMQIVFDGIAFGRTDKIAYLKDNAVAMNHIRSCWKTRGANNCSVCGKCMRVMIALTAHGARGRCTTFDWNNFSYEKLRAFRISDEFDTHNFFTMMLALPKGTDPELLAAMKDCVEQNQRYYKRLRRFEKLEYTRFIGWAFGHYKRRRVMDPKK